MIHFFRALNYFLVALMTTMCSSQSYDHLSSRYATEHRYAQLKATVRTGKTLCLGEQAYLKIRLPKVKIALQEILGMQLADHEVPRIAICSSGGGYRAMITTLGALHGCQIAPKREFNVNDFMHAKPLFSALAHMLLSWCGISDETHDHNDLFSQLPLSFIECCTYSAALSGSSWAWAGLLHSRKQIKDYIEHVAQHASEPLTNNVNLQSIVLQLLKKEARNQPVSFIDIYGSLLAERLLSSNTIKNAAEIDLLSYKNVIDAAQMPLPIFTAVIGENSFDNKWVEFTPYEVGTIFLNAFIPTWAFGRKFLGGHSIDTISPQTLGFCMGIWGSALSVSVEDVYNHAIKPHLGEVNAAYIASHYGKPVAASSALLQSIFHHIKNNSTHENLQISVAERADKRLSPAQVPNWTFGLPNSPYAKQELLTLIDAGFHINLPVTPLLRPERKIDIIIIIDASGNFGEHLKRTATEAQKHGYKFPPIDHVAVHSPCSVHRNLQDQSCPIVIYMPLIKNESYQQGWNPHHEKFTHFLNFNYTHEQVHQLSGLMQHNVLQSHEIIIDTIKQCIQAKRDPTSLKLQRTE